MSKKELINIRVISNVSSNTNVSLWTPESSINANTTYTYDLSSVNYADGVATITINSNNYDLVYNGTLQGLVNALNNLNFGYFWVNGTNVYTQDDTNVYGTFTFPASPLSLTFDNISSANTLVGGASSVSNWNTFFDLPTNGNPFTSVRLVGSEVRLYGGSNINVKAGLMYAYKNNTFLTGIIDYDGCIITVGGDSFSYCRGLTTAILNGCTILYGKSDSPHNDYGAFGACNLLNNVKLPQLVTIKGYAFSFSGQIGNIHLPNLVTIEDFGFYISGISTTNFPNVTSVGIYGVAACNSLTSITFPICTNVSSYAFYQTTVKTINFPLLTTVGDYAFGQSPISSVSLPLLQTSGIGLFTGCSALVTISLPLLTTMKGSTFDSCFNLVNVSLPEVQNMNPIVGLSGYHFLYCTKLVNITLPKATSIPIGTFFGCSKLESVNLPLATTLGTTVFQSCTSITTILLPSCSNLGGTVGNNNVFNGITGKTISLTIPASRMTANGGNPDGDIQYLQANNTVTVTTT